MKNKRLDVLLTERGYFNSREKAKAAIMAGEVRVSGQIFDKPGMTVSEDEEIEVTENSIPYVSRGGLKLKKAIDEFNITLKDLICMDIGASTGGFTDCMLKHGAKKVYAFDVGYGQLDYKLRTDPRVINTEKCNFRYFENEGEKRIVEEAIEFASIDVSFISLKHIFPKTVNLLADNGTVLALVKPQFEAGRNQVGKNGIVRDPEVHFEVIRNVIDYGEDAGLKPQNMTFSPINGAKGNIEYLLLLNKEAEIEYNDMAEKIKEIIDKAHLLLG